MPRVFLFFFLIIRRPPRPPLFPYTTLFRSEIEEEGQSRGRGGARRPSPRGSVRPKPPSPPPAARTTPPPLPAPARTDRKSTRLNSSHEWISYAVFCLKKKKPNKRRTEQALT